MEIDNDSDNVLSTIDDHCLIVKTRQSHVDNVGLYQATRYAWVLSEKRLNEIDYVLATINGTVMDVYTNLSWNRVEGGRFEFDGIVARDEIRNKYLGKKIPNIYRKKGMASPTLYTFSKSRNNNDSLVLSKLTLKLDSAVTENMADVLTEHFSNGFRINSPIEMIRFRSFAVKMFGEELSLPDEELKAYIRACGTIHEGKVYTISNETKKQLGKLVDDYFTDGAQAIFYAEFYTKNKKWLFDSSIISEDILIGIFRDVFFKLSFTKTYFGHTSEPQSVVLENEMLRVWGDDILLTYDQLAERLPYIPLDKLKHALGQNGDFIWNSVETFSHISRIRITNDEREAIRAATTRECNARGYVSITELPLDEIHEKNCDLSITAVHNAVYRICLLDKFDKKGKIITRKGYVFDALTIMKEYCRTIDKCSLSDLLAFEEELTGEVHRWIPMEAGNSILVRIDKNDYVADKYVHFDIDAIDDAIEFVVKNDYLPLKAFTIFSAFPDCGQTWNLFLLESYCRRFSRKFRFDTPSVNSRNAGAVIRRSCGLNYTEIMADAVANSDISLNSAAAGRFLFDSGYTGKSTTSKAGEIISKAKAMRGGV